MQPAERALGITSVDRVGGGDPELVRAAEPRGGVAPLDPLPGVVVEVRLDVLGVTRFRLLLNLGVRLVRVYQRAGSTVCRNRKEGRKEMFYLTMHSTHFIYGYMEREREREMFYLTMHSTHFIYGYMERERNVLFNVALNTFYLRLYGEREREREIERNVLFNDALNTFYLRLYGEREREKCFI